MKKILVFALLACLVIGCGSESDNGSKKTSSNRGKTSIDGSKIWKLRCLVCHGLHGNQELNGAANLQEVTTSLEERVAIITNGRQSEKGVMQAFGGILSPEEIEAVAKHTMTFNKDL